MNHWYLLMADYEYTAQTAQERATQERGRRQNRRLAWPLALAGLLGLW
jgi:hypothetical protein